MQLKKATGLIIFETCSIFLFFVTSLFSQSQEEHLTITTYYPSPHGVYRTLRLFPQNNFPTSGVGTGSLAYRTQDNAPAYLNNTGNWVVLATQPDLAQTKNQVLAIANATNNTTHNSFLNAETQNIDINQINDRVTNILNQIRNAQCPNCYVKRNCCPCSECASVPCCRYISKEVDNTGGSVFCPSDYPNLIIGGILCGSNYIFSASSKTQNSWTGKCKYHDEAVSGVGSKIGIICCK